MSRKINGFGKLIMGLLLLILLIILSDALFALNRGNLLAVKNTHVRVSAQDFSTSTLYRVARVVDGDTVDVLVNGENVRLRLIGIDTPEAVDRRKSVQCFGVEASRRAKVLLSGKSVRVETDPTQGRLDEYGRTLVYAYLPDGTSFNKKMIAEGYAHEYTFRYPYKYQSEFKEAERTAREEGIGLWAPGVCPS
mgnify:FL=1